MKLIHVLDGHPNVRKEKLGTYKWYYKESVNSTIGGNQNRKENKGTEKEKMVKVLKGKETKNGSNLIGAIGGIGGGVGNGNSGVGSGVGAGLIPYSGPAGIEVDLLPADSFPSVGWLRDYDMCMYRWAGNANEWTEYAMCLRPDVATLLESPGDIILSTLRRQSGCVVSVGSDMLCGKTEKFLVFVRGDSGQPSNASMILALNIFSQQMRDELYMPDHYDQEEEKRHMTGEGRVQRVLDIPQSVVRLIAGTAGKKLYAMRKKSGAYIALINKSKGKGAQGMARLTISGTTAAVENALSIVKQALSEVETMDHTLPYEA